MKKIQFLQHLFFLLFIGFFCQCADKNFVEVPDKKDNPTNTSITGIVQNTPLNLTPYGIAQRIDSSYIVVYGGVSNALKSNILRGNRVQTINEKAYPVGQVIINATKLTPGNDILLIGNNLKKDSVFVGLIKAETQELVWSYKIASPTASPIIGQDIIAKDANVFYAVVSNAPSYAFIIMIEPNLNQIKTLTFNKPDIVNILQSKLYVPTSIEINPKTAIINVAGNIEGVTSLFYVLALEIRFTGTVPYLSSYSKDSVATPVAIDNQFNIKVSRLFDDKFLYVSSFGAGSLCTCGTDHIEDNPYFDTAINRDSSAYICGNTAVATGNQLVIRKIDIKIDNLLPVKRITVPTLALKANKIIGTKDGGFLQISTATQTDGNTSFYIVKADKNGTLQ